MIVKSMSVLYNFYIVLMFSQQYISFHFCMCEFLYPLYLQHSH